MKMAFHATAGIPFHLNARDVDVRISVQLRWCMSGVFPVDVDPSTAIPVETVVTIADAGPDFPPRLNYDYVDSFFTSDRRCLQVSFVSEVLATLSRFSRLELDLYDSSAVDPGRRGLVSADTFVAQAYGGVALKIATEWQGLH